MLQDNNFYKGKDIKESNRDILKNYFNPYGYNIESNLKNNDLNDNKIRSESHIDRNNNSLKAS